MEKKDITLTCNDCGAEFVYSVRDQEFFTEKGFSQPTRCPACRAKRKAERNGGRSFNNHNSSSSFGSHNGNGSFGSRNGNSSFGSRNGGRSSGSRNGGKKSTGDRGGRY